MSLRVTIDESVAEQPWIELSRSAGEVLRVAFVVAVIVGVIVALLPAVREVSGLVLAALGITTGWSVVALAGREVYSLDLQRGLIEVTTQLYFARQHHRVFVSGIAAVHHATGGPEDNWRLVELVDTDGAVCLRLPSRLTTLGPVDQAAIGRTLAARLGVPLRGADVEPGLVPTDLY